MLSNRDILAKIRIGVIILLVIMLAGVLWWSIVLNPVVEFADPELKRAVMEGLGESGKDVRLNRLQAIEELEAADRGIKDLSGLENLIGLKRLNLRGNQIADISLLRGLQLLEELNLRGNQITDLEPVAQLSKLVYLNIHSNSDIESIAPVSGLDSLQILIMRNVPVGEEASFLRDLRELQRLNLRNCRVTDISFIVNLKELTQLDLRDNSIADLSPLALLPDLQDVELPE